MIKRIEGGIIIYIVFIALYMIFSGDSVVWNSIYYILQDTFILLLLLELFKQNISRHLIWTGLVFTIEHAIFFVSLINKDYITYYNALTSRNFCLILIISIAITLILVILFERKKWKNLGNG